MSPWSNPAFIGFGITWLLIITSFLFGQSRRKWAFYIFAPVVIFVGLSLFVNYMSGRDKIRQAVWREQGATSDRVSKVFSIFTDFQWLDFNNLEQTRAIDRRLNQNWLVGLAIERLENNQVSFTYGASFGAMLVALIPRAVWPDKPVVGGGGNLVQEVTGIDFAEGTSVGAGQVLEFYLNFGVYGVLAGFALWGWLLGYFDRRVADSLYQGDQAGFILWFLLAIALIQPGGNLLEIEVAAVTAALTAHGISTFIKRRARARRELRTVHRPIQREITVWH